jgi:hypothetical protein
MSGYTNGTITLDDQGDVKQAFIAKPFTPRALASRVREILDVSQSAREVA